VSKELLDLHMEQDKQRFDSIDKQLHEGDERMKSIDTKLDALIASANKQKGFIAGVSMAFSLLASTVIGLVIYIWNSLR
jgi:F0F1-type ATP synthase assembly protein I